MRILVDADACPVKEIIVRLAEKNKLPVIMFIDTSHIIDDGYSEVITVDRARDSADIALVNRAAKGDIVVTQDYGVAAMALARGAVPINQNGRVYSDDNIEKLLFERHLSQKVRRSGGRTRGPAGRTKEDDARFEAALAELLAVQAKIL